MNNAINVNDIKDNGHDLEETIWLLVKQVNNLREINAKLHSQLQHQDKLLKQLINNYNAHICGNECYLMDENEF